ncbi:MAG: hypothetical protein Q9176_006722 [Flavoplaca citrina]
MGRERRRWTGEEDSLLREAVRKATRESRPLLWRELAKSVPGRTNKDCRRRWCNILSDGTAKGSWTESEDERLSNAVREHGHKWTRVAASVGTRNSDQCSSHWSLSLNPDIDYSDWTRIEVPIITKTTLALKNRYSALRAKVLQIRDTPKSQVKSVASGNNAKSRAKRSDVDSHASVHTMTQEVDNQSDEEDEEDEDDEEDEEEEDDKVYIGGSTMSLATEERPMASSTRTRRRDQQDSCPSPPKDMQQDMDLDSAAMELWFQNPSMSAFTVPPGLAPHNYQGGGAHTSALNGMELDLGSLPNPGVSSDVYPDQEMYRPRVPDPGIPQSSMAAGYPTPNPIPDTCISGATYTTQLGHILPRAIDQDTTTQLNCSGSRREWASQQDSEPLQHQGMTSQAPATPDMSPETSKLSRVTPPPPQSDFPPESLQGPLHQVSINAECTTDQLGNLMRTLVGTTSKVVVQVHS